MAPLQPVELVMAPVGLSSNDHAAVGNTASGRTSQATAHESTQCFPNSDNNTSCSAGSGKLNHKQSTQYESEIITTPALVVAKAQPKAINITTANTRTTTSTTTTTTKLSTTPNGVYETNKVPKEDTHLTTAATTTTQHNATIQQQRRLLQQRQQQLQQKLQELNTQRQTTRDKVESENVSSSPDFVGRVLLAMRSSKSVTPTRSITNGSTTATSTSHTISESIAHTQTRITSTATRNVKMPANPPLATANNISNAIPSNGHSDTLPPLSKRNNDSASSLCSNDTVTSVQSNGQRPPVPPAAKSRVRKSMRLVPKQRERSPTVMVGDNAADGNKAPLRLSAQQQQYDADDGLLMDRRSAAHYLPTSGGYSSFNGASANAADKLLSGMRASPAGVTDHCRPLTTRSPSPALSLRSNATSRCSSYTSTTSHMSRSSSLSTASNYSRLQTPPRRVFPQTYTRGDPIDAYEMRNMESSPVIFDANLSFVLGCKRQPVFQSLRASPSHEDPRTASACLTEKIQNFLRRTDHVQEEWSAQGRRSSRRSRASNSVISNGTDSGRTTPTNSVYDDYDTISLIERQRERNSMERSSSLGRSRNSAQNILTKAFQLTKALPHTPTASRSNSVARESAAKTRQSTSKAHSCVDDDDDDDRTIHEEDNDMDELSEMTVDLTEERSTANMATDRLEAETAERLKLEKELNDQQQKVKNLQETSEKLEMELLICAKSSELNGLSEDEDPENEENGGAGGVYKLKYERVARELEFTKRRLQTQHEHDLEQLVGLKKQLEKKLSDAYEEVEEQRQVVGQWKRKAQKMTNEMNDLRMLIEEQNARNNMLEKKQRKFDVECQSLQDAARQERQSKDRLSREKDVLIAEKFTLEQNLSDTRLELELKEEKLSSLQRELEEMTFAGGTEEEIAQLRRSKNELDRRVKEQEEELDEMAGQVQLLEQAKLRLEMSLETMRKDARREAQQRDDELEEARNNAYKKMKALECQLETEHEERTLLLREKHELERRLASMEDQDRLERQAEEAVSQKLRRDLRKYKALLKDAQTQLDRLKAETPGKALIRQLRNQLEDAESARTLAMKARQAADAELAEVQTLFDESHRARSEAEDRANAAHRDRAELQAQIDENEEELAELMKKYSATVKQLNTEQMAVSEYEFKLSEVEAERSNLREQVSELQHRLDNVENMADPSAAMLSKRLELRSRELESRLELEQATRARLEVQVARHKEALEKVQQEVATGKGREMQSQDALKKVQKSLRDMREEFHSVSGREQESIARRKDLEKKLEQVEAEAAALKNDLRLALQRIADLQQAMEEGDDDEVEDDDISESDASQSSGATLSDLEARLQPITVKRGGAVPSTTTTLVREKEDNSPRITLTSPSSPHIHKLAATAMATTTSATTKVTVATTAAPKSRMKNGAT